MIMFLVVQAGISDNIDQIELEEAVLPVAPSAVPGLTALVPFAVLDDREVAGGIAVFGFQPGVDIVPGKDDFFIVSYAQEGGWINPGRATIYKFDKNGNKLAGPVTTRDNSESFGISKGWHIAAFSDGGCVAVGGSRFGLGTEDGLDLSVIDREVSGYRIFDATLKPLTALKSVWEPANQPGNDDRDPDVDQRALVERLSNDRFVVVLSMQSVNMQLQFGLTDNGNTPAGKIVYRVFEKDGTPVGPSRWAFPVSDENGGWDSSQSNPDVVAGPDGTFAIIAVIPGLLANGDPYPLQFFDNNGERVGEPFGVVDQTLIDEGTIVQPGIISPKLGYGDGVYVSGVNIKLVGLNTNTFGVTVFGQDKKIIRSTYDGLRHKDNLPEVREGDLTSDPSGNFFVVDRSDQAFDGSADADKIQFMQMHTRDGKPFGPSFITFPPDDSIGSQRDPAVDANANIFVVASLNEGVPGDVNTLSGVNTLAVYANPMPQTQTAIHSWMLMN